MRGSRVSRASRPGDEPHHPPSLPGPKGPGGYLRLSRVDSAHRFLREAEATFRRLAEFPGTGAQYDADDPLFEGIRVSPVSRFKKDVICDRPIEGGIEVLRVLHGARDIPGLVAESLGIPGDGDHPTDVAKDPS